MPSGIRACRTVTYFGLNSRRSLGGVKRDRVGRQIHFMKSLWIIGRSGNGLLVFLGIVEGLMLTRWIAGKKAGERQPTC